MLRCFYGGPTEKETELRIIKEVFARDVPWENSQKTLLWTTVVVLCIGFLFSRAEFSLKFLKGLFRCRAFILALPIKKMAY